MHCYQQEGRKQLSERILQDGICESAYKWQIEQLLTDIEEQAQERFERIIEQMEQAQGITEQLKEENALEWIGRMNNIQACAREIVEKEIIYQ